MRRQQATPLLPIESLIGKLVAVVFDLDLVFSHETILSVQTGPPPHGHAGMSTRRQQVGRRRSATYRHGRKDSSHQAGKRLIGILRRRNFITAPAARPQNGQITDPGVSLWS
jgi:hypothetical protein